MLVTEEEAKKRWCPMVRHSNGPDGTWNRYASNPQIPEHYKCIASECMAWRPVSPRKWRVTFDGKTEDWSWNPTGVEGYEDAKILPPEPRGYCGLSGNPTAGG